MKVPRFVSTFVDRHGRRRYRFRRSGLPQHYFRSRFGTAAFASEYAGCLTGETQSQPPPYAERSPPKRSKRNQNKQERVYFIAIRGGPIKIGRSCNPRARLRELQISQPAPLRLLAVIAGGRGVEANFHRRFAHAKIRGEWYTREPDLMAEIAVFKGSRLANH